MTRIIEAAWLGVLLWVPWLFDPFGARAFTPWKAWILRTLAVVALVAFLPRLWDQDVRSRIRQRAQHPIVWGALAFFSVTAFASATSIAVRKSLFGEYFQQHGLLTTASAFTIFAVMCIELRERAQFVRVIYTIVFAATAVAVYGGVQHFGLDPVPWVESMRTPVSTLGNPIFLSGYLAVTIPLTVGLAVHLLKQERWALGIFAFLSSLLQATTAVFTASRGPLLALAVAGWIGGLVWASTSGRRRLKMLVASLGAIGAAALIVLAWGPPFLSFARDIPIAGELVGFARVQSPTAATRLWVWEGAAKAAIDPPVRLIWGHGPETAQLVIPAHVRRRLAVYEARPVLTRSHNELWDHLVTRGLLGAAAWLFWIAALLSFSAPPPTRRFHFIAVGAGGVCGAVLSLLLGVELLAVLVPLGMTLGSAVIWATSSASTHAKLSFLQLGLLVAIVAHVLEILVGVTTLASHLLLWALSALAVVDPTLVRSDKPEKGKFPVALAIALVSAASVISVGRFAWRDPVRFVSVQTIDEITGALTRPVTMFALVLLSLFVFMLIATTLRERPRLVRSALYTIPVVAGVVVGWLGLPQMTSDVLFKVARDDLHRAQHVAEAVTMYGEAIKQLPNEDYYVLIRSKAHLDIGALDDAQADIERAHSLSPEEPNTLYARARVLRHRALASTNPVTRNKLLEQSLDWYELAAKKQSFAPELWIDWGLTLSELGRHPEALAKLDKIHKDLPDNVYLWVLKGQVHGSAGDLDAAQAHFERALEMKPGYLEAMQGLGLVLIRRGRHEEAGVYLRKVADRQRKSASMQLLTARTLARAGQVELARVYGKRALRLAPEDPSTRAFLETLAPNEE